MHGHEFVLSRFGDCIADVAMRVFWREGDWHEFELVLSRFRDCVAAVAMRVFWGGGIGMSSFYLRFRD